MLERIAYINTSKKGTLYFKIGKKTFIIIDRPADEIGNQNNYSTQAIYQIKNNNNKK